MSAKTPDDIRTLAYVLRRTNYGEADRILNLLTPTGQYSAIARGVRKENHGSKAVLKCFLWSILICMSARANSTL